MNKIAKKYVETPLVLRIFIGLVMGVTLGLAVPSATINMDGAAITINVLTLAVCHTMGTSVDIPTALNSSGDVMFAATAEFHDRLKRGEKIDF